MDMVEKVTHAAQGAYNYLSNIEQTLLNTEMQHREHDLAFKYTRIQMPELYGFSPIREQSIDNTVEFPTSVRKVA